MTTNLMLLQQLKEYVIGMTVSMAHNHSANVDNNVYISFERPNVIIPSYTYIKKIARFRSM
jgi:hypothetical protein